MVALGVHALQVEERVDEVEEEVQEQGYEGEGETYGG